MKKIFSALLAVLALQGATQVQAGCCDTNDCCNPCDPCGSSWFQSPSLEFKVGGIYPFESRVRDVYYDVLPVVELEAAFKLGCNWKPWVNVGYVWADGHSIGSGERHSTHLSIIPLTFGVDYVFNWGCNTDLYIGAGAAYSWLKIHDHDEFVHEHTNKGAWGGLARVGLIYHFCDCWFLDAYLDYFYTRWSFSDSVRVVDGEEYYIYRNDLNLSSLKFGVGIGYNF